MRIAQELSEEGVHPAAALPPTGAAQPLNAQLMLIESAPHSNRIGMGHPSTHKFVSAMYRKALQHAQHCKPPHQHAPHMHVKSQAKSTDSASTMIGRRHVLNARHFARLIQQYQV
jgi:hypothetical protein